MSDTKQILSPYFKSIVDQDRLSIVICDLEHTIIYMNPAAIEDYHKYVQNSPECFQKVCCSAQKMQMVILR